MCESQDNLDVQDIQSECTMKTESDSSEPLVLEPDHPMMQRFQKALKGHLERMLENITTETTELGNELKMKEKEKEAAGLELYTLQQELYRQQLTLDKCEESIENFVKEREESNKKVTAKRTQWKEQVDKLNAAKKKEHELTVELQKLMAMEKQFQKWEVEMESNLAVSQRISEKTQADKNKLIDEKRKMDMHMLRLMAEVSNFEAEIKLMDAELDIKWEEKTAMQQTLCDANADLQALMDEQKRLFTSWNSVVAVMGQRDAVYSTMSNELTVCQEAFKTLTSEIESYKRSAVEAMKKNEQLAQIHVRISTEKETAEAALKATLHRKEEMERKITMFASTIGELEKNIPPLKMEVVHIEAELYVKLEEHNKLNTRRQAIEDEILALIQGQVAVDKRSAQLNTHIRQVREKSRKLELIMIEKENKISKRFLEVEDLKAVIASNNEIVNAMNKDLAARENELKTTENDIAKCHLSLMQKQSSYANLVKNIERQMEKQGTSKPGQDPGQARVAELEKLNSEMQEKNDKMQSFWLAQQNHNVKLTNQRNQQIKELNMLRKQLAVLEQKTLKTELEIEKEQEISCVVNKSIAMLQNKMTHLSNKFNGKKDYTEILNKETVLMQTNFLQTLKHAEMEQIKMKSEITELEASMEELGEKMLETQKEILTWERKIKLASDTKDSIEREKAGSGEIGQMKIEIHRMEIRYDQLKKAQEKLMNDMELCVLRRDTIMEIAQAKEKRLAQGFNSRFMVQKKLDNLKNRIKSLENERCKVEKTINRIQLGQEDLKDNIKIKEEILKDLEEKENKLKAEVEDARLNKQQNLEMLVRRQNKCKMYNQVKLGKHRMLHKHETVLDSEIQKEKDIKAALVSVSEALIEDFPAHNFNLRKILNTARAEPS